ncbi:GAF domain-containing protein, partial [candidate division KSB1 bacterium]|nr:GAF domain-containing protein [candidate division KSB1 bacterium]
MHETVNQEQDKISILSAIVEVIASKDNIIDIFKEIREYLYSIIPCDYITVLFNNESARYFYIVPALNITKSIIKGEITIPYHETSITEILRSKATIKRDDLDERGNMTPGDLKFLLPGIRSDLSIPVITQNRVRAVINCSSYKSNVFTPVHQTLLEEIGLILSISLRRIDLEEEVRSLKTNINQWRTKYKTLLENSKQPIVVINSDLASIYEANKSFEVLTGYNSQQLNGMRFTGLHPKIQAHILTKTVQNAVQGKTSQLNQIELLQNNGENIFVNLQFYALEQNEEPKLFAVYEQVAKQKPGTREQNSQIQSLIDVGNELLATNNLELMSISLLDGLGINQNARYVTLHLYDNDQQKLNLYCARKFPFENGMSIMHPWLLGLKQGPYTEVLEQDRIFKCNNVFTDKQFHRWLPIAQKLGYSAMVSLPLIMPHRKLGVLTLFYEQAQDFSSENISSLKNISNYLALLLNDHNLNQQFKTTERRLAVIQKILNCVNSGSDLKETIQTTAIQIKNMIKYDHFSITVFDSNAENYHIYAVASETYNKLFEPESFTPIEQSDLGWLHVPIDQPEQNGKMTLFNSWFSKLKSRMDTLLLVKNKYLGAITIGSLEPNIYSRQHEDFLKDISAHISFAIENSRLHAETRKKLDSFSILAELCDDVKNVTDLDELISTMLHFIGKAVNAPLSTFRFVEHEKANLRVYST